MLDDDCIACRIYPASFTIGGSLPLCSACLRNAQTFAGYPSWTEEMKQQRERLLKGQHHVNSQV